MLKLVAHSDYLAQIKEEIIEVDPQIKKLRRIAVIVERAKYTLNDLLEIWTDQQKSSELLEFFSPEKLSFYFLYGMCSLDYLHSKNIYYGDMKLANLLVFRNQQVKIGDLGISVKLDNI